METLRLLIRLSRPLYLAGVAIVYALGVGIARYLGATIAWDVYLMGQFWVTLLQLGGQFLHAYFNDLQFAAMSEANRQAFRPADNPLQSGEALRRTALPAALTSMAFLASLTVVMIARINPPPVAYLAMGAAFLGVFFFSAPPVRLEVSGYGELVLSVLIGYLTPVFAFLLQTGETHRLVAMSAMPLAALLLAMLLAWQLPVYALDLKQERPRLMIRLGWKTGMGLHNLLIFSAFLLLVIARFFGYPWFATLAGLLPLPVGMYQVWQMRAISNGVKPNWRLLTTGAAALFALTAYLLALAFWTN